MIMLTRVPRPPLSELISLFWLCDGHEMPPARERVLPTGCMQIIISLRNNGFRTYDPTDETLVATLSGAILAGPSSEFTIINTADTTSTIGVSFKPGGARPFFNFPADAIYGQDLELEVAWGRAATNELRERLIDADSPDDKFRVLEESLLARASRRLACHPAIAFALGKFDVVPHVCTVGDVTAQVGVSHRRLIELFRETVGLTPKRFCRLRRFQEVLGLISRGRGVDWAGVASDCGYFDQAHLIHDFRAFSGLTPSDYLRLRTAYHNHVRLE
jgi:AraC-like DNA-binding protein